MENDHHGTFCINNSGRRHINQKEVTIYKFIIILFVSIICSTYAGAYSVLTHEAIIDVEWDKVIVPLLLQKYPGATEAQLKDAHAYAYGGAVMPDMGYYPFGSQFFTDLIHYVRSGDFVSNLLNEANDINEYAFALGAMSHYFSDKYGHPIGTNHCVPIVYTKDKKKFGSVVTYEQDPLSHKRMEFGFDILQTASGNYASEKYHEFIGFQFSRPVLERAFLKTYGLEISDLFNDLPKAISSFRWITKDLFPVMTRAAWASKKNDIVKANPGMTKKKFEYKMRKANYYHEYGRKLNKPGVFPGVLGWIVKVMPKVGPLKTFKVIMPGPEAEKIFIQSFDTVLVHYSAELKSLSAKKYKMANIDFDTGNETVPGEYSLADNAYAQLLLTLNGGKFNKVSSSLQQNILNFYSGCNEKGAALEGAETWDHIDKALDSLKIYHSVN